MNGRIVQFVVVESMKADARQRNARGLIVLVRNIILRKKWKLLDMGQHLNLSQQKLNKKENKMNMTIEQLAEMKPCDEALAFVRECGSLKKAWETCVEPSWLIWFARQKELINKKQMATITAVCMERALSIYGKKYPKDMPQQKIDAIKKWLNETEKNCVATLGDSISFAVLNVHLNAAALAAAHGDESSLFAFEKERIWQCDKIREVLGSPFEKE